MAVVPVTPGPHNTFIPNTAATKNMVVDFSRNPNKFALPNYCQYVPVDKTDGRYMRMTVEVAGRILNVNLAEFLWPDGTEQPMGYPDREKFGFFSYRTERFAFAFTLGQLAVEQAEWDVLAHHARIAAQRCMTARTQAAGTLLQTGANFGTTADVDAMDGVTGQHDLSTTARKDIKRSFDVAALLVVDLAEVLFL